MKHERRDDPATVPWPDSCAVAVLTSMNRFAPRVASATAVLCAPLAALAAGIPLCPGLTIVTAVSQKGGDYESIKKIETLDARELRLRYASEGPDTDPLSSTYGKILTNKIFRRVALADLESATLYQQIFVPDADELIPGSTSLGTSRQVLRALKTRGESPFSISLLPPSTPLRASRDSHPHAYDFFTPGVLKRVGTEKITVLVNNRPVELPAIRARGDFAGETSEFVFLDDENNPLTLRMRIGIDALKAMNPALKETCASLRAAQGDDLAPMFAADCREKAGDRDLLQVVKIGFQCSGSPPPRSAGAGPELPGAGQAPGGSGNTAAGAGGLERALQEGGKADVYSIFFSFNSDVIREESAETLQEIGALLRKHPDWKLAIYGHTDNVASDTYNLQLSKRRAAAVVAALGKRYGVDPSRLTSSGYGEAAPRDTNDTLEGRANNRRVELVRLP
jgi:outer membrane protein OmpA-like peptidoglycan-associated protein